MTPAGEVIATAKGLGDLRLGERGVLPNQKGDLLKHNASKQRTGQKYKI
jgi:hypothetical protein